MPSPATDTPALPPAPRSRSRLRPWLLALLLWAAVAAAVGLGLWHLRGEAVAGQSRELSLLSLALTDEIDRGLRGAEEGLLALRSELQQGRLATDAPGITNDLATRAGLMPLVRTLWLLDEAGRVRAASGNAPAPALADFAPPLAGLAEDAVALSRPVFLNAQNAPDAPTAAGGASETLVALALHIEAEPRGPDEPAVGSGWIVAALPASALLGAFSAAAPAPDARMAVFRADGVRLAGANVPAPAPDEAQAARRLARAPGLQLLRRGDGGADQLLSLHDVPRYGLKVLVSRELAAVLAAWRQAAQVVAAALLLVLAVTAAALHGVQRANRKRRDAQQALQAQLARASRLESLGTLAGGVAHDFNNVLAGIVGYGEMAQEAASPGSDQARHIDKLLQAAGRGKALVARVLAFSRGGARSAVVFELEPVVEEVLQLLAASLRPGVVIERALEAPGARLRGDPTQAFEAVMNLCTNALQAMPQGGMLSVQLRRDTVAARRVLSHSALAPGDYIALSVSDEGAGITAEVMERLFEPFFTTRAAQAGTGLGLAVVHGVVAELHGAIDVASQPGHGARFTLYLPESHGAAAADSVAPDAPARGAGEHVLVVDDEPELVGLALEALRGLGYQPEGCIDAVAALQLLREQPGRFAAVITDERMPGLTGTQFTAALRAFAPQLPVLLLSGYGGAGLAQRAAAAGVTRLRPKPLPRAELARVLADMLH